MTALAKDPAELTADVVLALLGGLSIDVHDGHVDDSDESEKTVSAELPYVVLHMTPGAPVTPRLASRRGRAVEFMVNAVGETRAQAMFAGALAESVLAGKRVELAEGSIKRLIRRTDENPFVRRDDTWTRPDGGPLFVDSRRYSIRAR